MRDSIGFNPLLNCETIEGSRENSTAMNHRIFEVYSYRWIVLTVFILAGVSNAIVLLTWSPISDKAQTFWNNIDITAINLLSVVFQICYVPGTMLGLYYSERYALRGVLLIGGLLTTIGCIIRLLGVIAIDGGGRNTSYAIVLFGTILVGLAQPFYLNMPAKIAATWFGVKERDIATTMASLGNPLGSAIGSLLPPMLVSQDSDHSIEIGIRNLLLIQTIIASVILVITFCFFRSRPNTPASASAEQMQIMASTRALNTMFGEMQRLLETNRNFVQLLFSFTIVLGNLNAIAALLNQLPGGYSNGTAGTAGALLILSGFVGAFMTGFLLDWTKAYRAILKTSYILTGLFWIFFFSNCRAHNDLLFLLSAALLGLATLPIIPASIVACVECSYPVSEEVCVGLMYMGANVFAIACTFGGQVLLQLSSLGPAPLFPYAIVVGTLLVMAATSVFFFQGSYFRLEQDAKHLLNEA